MPPNSNSERQIRYDLDIEGTDKLIALTNITERFNVVLDKETNSIKMLKSVSAEYMKGQEKKQVVMAQGLAVDKKKTEQLIKEVPHLKAKNKELEKQVKLNTQMRPAGTSTTETVGQFGEKNVSTINKYADGMGNTRKEVVKTTQGLEKLSVWQKISGGHWDSAFPRITKVNNALNTLRWSMVNVAFAFAGVAALLTPFVLLTKYGMDLETQFKRVAVVTGATMEECAKVLKQNHAQSVWGVVVARD